MQKMNLGVLNIVICFNPANIQVASLTSGMKASDTKQNITFNAAVDALESLILAHFCAGVDIACTDYLEGVETAYEGLSNNIDSIEDTYDESKVTIQKTRIADARVTEEVCYEIDKGDWHKIMQEHGNERVVSFESQRDLKVKRISCDVVVDVIVEEHSVEVIEI